MESQTPFPASPNPQQHSPLNMRTTLLMDSTSTYNSAAVSPVHQQHQQQRSPWNSPVPYMFGGLAAMLGLIALALLILACSYWRVSREEDGGESVPKESSLDVEKPVRMLEQKVVVIMAGELRPTYIATPVYSKNVSCMSTDNSDVVGKNSGQGGGGGCTNDEEEKKDAPPPHSHLVIDIEGESGTEEDQRSR